MPHPETKRIPPMGVIAPIQRSPVKTRIYNLPEKIRVPIDYKTAGVWMISEL